MPSPFAGGVPVAARAPATAPPQPAAPQAPAHAAGATQPFHAPPQPAAPASSGGGLKQTMLGFAAPPVPHPAQAVPAPIAPSPAPANAAASARGGASPLHQKTMLGVAHPGIAPRHAGAPTQAPPTAPSPDAAPPTPVAPMPELAQQRPSSSRRMPESDPSPPPKRAGIPRGAIVLIAVAAVLAVTAGVVAFLWESPRPLVAEVALDERGAEALNLRCEDCADGTVVTIGASKSTFAAKTARLSLAKSLEVGKNELTVSLQRPGMGRNEEVSLSVGIDYRVRGDLSPLADDPPRVKVLVQAVQGAAVVVDGHAVTLDATGKGEYAVDVSRELEGPADTVAPFERKLPYTVTLPGSAAHTGDVTLRFGIVPLRIDAPGNGIVIEGETFMLSGHTLKEGRVSVGGRPITVDAEGRFAQLMNVSSVGETTIVVRAEAKDQAPRLVRVRVKRVASLKDTAAEFEKTALTDYRSVASETRTGVPAALQGEVVESRLDGEVTVLLLDVKSGCEASPCLAKVVYGGRFDARRGADLGAYGTLAGKVDGPRTGAQIPELSAEFLLATPAKKKR